MGFMTPAIGTIFWMLVIFGIAFWVLKKFAWKAILDGLKEREESISKALLSAEDAKKEVASIKANQENIIDNAKKEKDEILKEARVMKEQILSEAKINAQQEASKIIEQAKVAIQVERKAAINEMKKEIAELSIQIASKVIAKELDSNKEQETLVNNLLNDINLN